MVPYAIVELGPAMAKGIVTGIKRENLLAHVLVQLGYYEIVDIFEMLPHN